MMWLTGLVLYPVGTGLKKGSLFKNIISPPRIRLTPPAFGRIYLQIHLFSVVALSLMFFASIEIFGYDASSLSDTCLGGLMWIMQKVMKNNKKAGLGQFQNQKSWRARITSYKERLKTTLTHTNLNINAFWIAAYYAYQDMHVHFMNLQLNT